MNDVKTIVIDGRGYSGTTGRYTRKLIEYLEILESSQEDRKYVVLLHAKEYEMYTPSVKCFSKAVADYKHYSFEEQIGFYKYLKNLNADLVHFTMPQQPIFYKGKHITNVHDMTLLNTYAGNKNWLVYHLKQIVGKFVFKQIANTSSYIITLAEYTKSEYAKFSGVSKKKIVVTPAAADTSTEPPVPYSPLFDKKYIMYVGQQSTYKNLRRLIQAHQLLLSTLPSLQLVLAGKLTESAQRNKKWVEQHNYKNVVFTDYVSDGELAWLYKNCSAYVFPSLMEGFGLPSLEAMTYGVPVVSSNATCLPEVNGDAAHYFDPKNIDEMSAAIHDVLTDGVLRKRLISNGHKQLKKYSWKRMAEQTLSLYKKTLL